MRDWLLGVIFGIAIGTIGMSVIWSQPTVEEMLRDYKAYKACIPKPMCMKADDYLDYYDLKWKLQAIKNQ